MHVVAVGKYADERVGEIDRAPTSPGSRPTPAHRVNRCVNALAPAGWRRALPHTRLRSQGERALAPREFAISPLRYDGRAQHHRAAICLDDCLDLTVRNLAMYLRSCAPLRRGLLRPSIWSPVSQGPTRDSRVRRLARSHRRLQLSQRRSSGRRSVFAMARRRCGDGPVVGSSFE